MNEAAGGRVARHHRRRRRRRRSRGIRNRVAKLVLVGIAADRSRCGPCFETPVLLVHGYAILHEAATVPPTVSSAAAVIPIHAKRPKTIEANTVFEELAEAAAQPHVEQSLSRSDNDLRSRSPTAEPTTTTTTAAAAATTVSQCPFHRLVQAISSVMPSFFQSQPQIITRERATTTNPTPATGTSTATATASTALSPSPALARFSPFESWWLSGLDTWYSRSQSLRCPFFRRRSGDLLDGLEVHLIRGFLVRADRLPYLGPLQAVRPCRSHPKKQKGLSPKDLSAVLRRDWKANPVTTTPKTHDKGYYLTGRLTTAIYRDDCLFLGPDPDLPLRGLRKYTGVAAHLFEYHTSTATLLSMDVLEHEHDDATATATRTTTTTTTPKLVAHWKLDAALRLPWKPRLPELVGRTIYHTDSDGLICCHEEHWEECSTPRAFVSTFLPGIASLFWPSQ